MSTGVDESIEPAVWASAVSEQEIDDTERWLGASIPAAWTAFLRRDRRLVKGWLVSGDFIWLESPAEARELIHEWDETRERHPGVYRLGTDGSRDIYCIDLRHLELGVQLTDIVSAGWEDAEPLGLSVEAFVRRIDDGSFTPDR